MKKSLFAAALLSLALAACGGEKAAEAPASEAAASEAPASAAPAAEAPAASEAPAAEAPAASEAAASEAPASEAAKSAFSTYKKAGYFAYPAFLIFRAHLTLFLNLHSFFQKHD